jgi:4-hydroxy-tetrahydrodipicolinate synthase
VSPGAARFGAVVTAMVTPFRDDLCLDAPGAADLARWLVANGSDAIVVAGSTGEGSILDDAERLELIRAVRGAVTAPVIAATGAASTSHSIELTRSAEEAGCDAVLVVTPYYVRPSQAGLYEHFRSVAASTRLPVVIYDIPARTGRKIAPETVLRLAADCANVVGLKDAAGEVAATARLIAQAPAGFEVYCGDDALTLPMMSVGAVGVISVASHWAGAQMGEMVAHFLKGDVEAAAQANAALLESWGFESSEDYPNPLPAKAAMRVMGLPAGHCRPPLGEAGPELEQRAREVIGRLRAVAR